MRAKGSLPSCHISTTHQVDRAGTRVTRLPTLALSDFVATLVPLCHTQVTKHVLD